MLPGGRTPTPPWNPPLASIGSPNPAAWRLGPLPVRAYALCVTAGILVALVVAGRRYRRGGGQRGVMLDVAAWAVPFGLIGAAAGTATGTDAVAQLAAELSAGVRRTRS